MVSTSKVATGKRRSVEEIADRFATGYLNIFESIFTHAPRALAEKIHKRIILDTPENRRRLSKAGLSPLFNQNDADALAQKIHEMNPKGFVSFQTSRELVNCILEDAKKEGAYIVVAEDNAPGLIAIIAYHHSLLEGIGKRGKPRGEWFNVASLIGNEIDSTRMIWWVLPHLPPKNEAARRLCNLGWNGAIRLDDLEKNPHLMRPTPGGPEPVLYNYAPIVAKRKKREMLSSIDPSVLSPGNI
ncbi:MAG: hypothetical protein AB1468_05760 [Candidatus Micrarchaeota archaeon]